MNTSSNRSKRKRNILIISFLTAVIVIASFIVFFLIRESGCPYDLNEDGVIGLSDLTSLASKSGKYCSGCKEDVNHDGIINNDDIQLLYQYLGKSCDSIDFKELKQNRQKKAD
ncbi:MAG: hypothetical protein PVF73_14060 [Bacteroidales bacterium]|jgi:hypothetical protein